MSEPDLQKPYLEQSLVARANGTGRPLSLVVVEDNPADVSLFRLALKRCSAEIRLTTASNGVEALELLREPSCQPDLVILDINLPMIDGFGILERYRERPARSPVVIFTSSNRSEDVARAGELGALAIMEKPADLWAFHDAVFTMIRMVAPNLTVAERTLGNTGKAAGPPNT